MRIPATLTAGDTATWTDLPFADGNGATVDATAYALTYSLRGPVAAAGFDLQATASGTGWLFSLAAAQTAALNATGAVQRWYWQAWASKSGARITAGAGTLLVKPNLAGLDVAATYDGRSPAEQILATVEAAILARTNGDLVTEYTIGTRSLRKEPITELLALRDRYRLIVAREAKAKAIAAGLGNPSRMGVRFRA